MGFMFSASNTPALESERPANRLNCVFMMLSLALIVVGLSSGFGGNTAFVA
jgi:hypothetical protein